MTHVVRTALPSLFVSLALLSAAVAQNWGDAPLPEPWDGFPVISATAGDAPAAPADRSRYRLISTPADKAPSPPPPAPPLSPDPVIKDSAPTPLTPIAERAGCDGSSWEACFADCCGPLWTVRSDAIFLHRSKPDDLVLATDGAGGVLLDASRFDFDFHAGFDVSLRRHDVFGTCWDLEALYFGIDDWSAAVGPVVTPGGLWVEFAVPVGWPEGDGSVNALYRSELHNVELNGWRQLTPWLSFLAGFRYLSLEEQLITESEIIDGPRSVALGTVRASNDLFGFQIGADARVWSGPCLDLNCVLKAGVYSNDPSNSAVLIIDGITVGQSRASERHTTFVGELDFSGTYRLNPCWAVRGGYQLLWIEGVALASDQLAVSAPTEGIATVDTGGSPFYHGAFVGLEFRR